ncbi:MAG: hypothetical protein JWP65_717 [Ramlibacter sp.]|uniref:hypothetical protein n=1 Tax=Ramlibacter sp. TaxID=1917967 RepID=UPI00261B5A0D|nr:hypothetical protein [Ramlibacter sp.]MDB5750296.1 hypothetical protein [Ramlibacter sp.]
MILEHDGERIAALEQKWITELKVVSDIFGCNTDARREWAVGNLDPADHVEHYLSGWRQSKRAAWTRLRSLADELRDATGDTPQQWQARLTRLEAIAGQQAKEPPPTASAELTRSDHP